MEKVCQNWPGEAFSDDLVKGEYWKDFETNAKAAAAEVYLVKDYAEAQTKVNELIKSIAPNKIVAAGGDCDPNLQGIYDGIKATGVEVITEKFAIAENAPSADLGISFAEFGVGETGSVCVDTCSYEARVVGMLPKTHIVFINANYMVENVTTAFKVISRVFRKGHMGFITGPSRTADIERVLTLGVHGPHRFIVIAVKNVEGSVN